MNNPKTLAAYEVKESINNETGEIITNETIKTFKAETEPNYIKLYLQDITYLNNLPGGSDVVLFELLKYLNYEHEIVLTKHIKQKIADNINKSFSTVNNLIPKLVKQEILIKVDRSVYTINTFLFGKGSWKDVLKHRKTLELKIFYSYKDGKSVTTEIKD